MVAIYNSERNRYDGRCVLPQLPVWNRNQTADIVARAAAINSQLSAPSRDHSAASAKIKPQSWGNPDSFKA